MKKRLLIFVVLLPLIGVIICGSCKKEKKEYSTYSSFVDLIGAKDSKYADAVRITDAGTLENPIYHGFFFYSCAPKDQLQFDPTGRYMLGMQVKIEGRDVTPSDTAEIGIIDLKDKNKWTPIGKTTAWNWQQGCRLEWIPGTTDQIIYDDRSSDGKSFVSRVYDVTKKTTRTLPRPIYTISPDGKTALTHEFERMEHGGTNFVGIPDPYKEQWAPEGAGIWKMDVENGQFQQIISVRQMAKIIYPDGLPSDTTGGSMYFFREGFNVSGNRFIAFVKDVRKNSSGQSRVSTSGFSMTPEGKDIRFLYREPSHHYWIDDETVMDNSNVVPPGATEKIGAYCTFKDDGSGEVKEILFVAPNGHDVYHPGGEWILTDTYSNSNPGEPYDLNGFAYLYLYHIKTKKFVPIGKYEFRINGKYTNVDAMFYRVDLHPRLSPDGRSVSFDSTHEGGRQIYLVDIGHILDNPPSME